MEDPGAVEDVSSGEDADVLLAPVGEGAGILFFSPASAVVSVSMGTVAVEWESFQRARASSQRGMSWV